MSAKVFSLINPLAVILQEIFIKVVNINHQSVSHHLVHFKQINRQEAIILKYFLIATIKSINLEVEIINKAINKWTQYL